MVHVMDLKCFVVENEIKKIEIVHEKWRIVKWKEVIKKSYAKVKQLECTELHVKNRVDDIGTHTNTHE